MNASLVSLLARAAFMHHADPTGLIHSRRVVMMHECSPGEQTHQGCMNAS